jgi:hypothetical protein
MSRAVRHTADVICVTLPGLRERPAAHHGAVDTPGSDPLELADRLFPERRLPALLPGDGCTLDGDPRPHRIAAIQGDMAVVYLAALPSATYRRVRLDDCIPYPEAEAG